jgi:hypothetical protein
MSGLDSGAIMDVVVSHAQESGYFDKVFKHEPKAPPGNGVTGAVILGRIQPYQARSGLATTSVMVALMIRVYKNFLAEPQDDIDPDISKAVDALFTAYIGDFDLGGTASNVDIYGNSGVGLVAVAGHLTINNAVYRTMDITLPVIVNDVWTQVA